MNCTTCGSPFAAGGRFCASCGTSIAMPDIAPGRNRSTSNPRPLKTYRLGHDDQFNRPPVSHRSSDRDFDARRMGAYTRSFTTPAIFTLVLYCVFWIPGLIANIVYLREASKIQRLTGSAPEGKGCLTAMLLFFSLGILVVCGFWAILFGGLVASAGM